MPDLPVMLKLRGRRCVVVGGGPVALRRASALTEAGGTVVVIAPRPDPPLRAAAATVLDRPYRAGDLAGALLVVVATDDPAVNAAVAADARAAGVLVNRADEPDEGDLAVPAHCRRGPVTLAVHTSGISAAAAAHIRDQLADALDPAWIELLQAAAPYRAKIQDQFPDPQARRQRLLDLTGPRAMSCLKEHGPQALRRHLEDLVKP